MEKLEACFQLVGCKNVTTSVYTIWEFFNTELACAQRVYSEVYILRNRKLEQGIVDLNEKCPSRVFLFDPQLVSLFSEVMKPLEAGALLDEVCLQGTDLKS